MHLLIMACSSKKNPTKKEVPAINLYEGVFYSVLRNAFKENPRMRKHIKVLIVSAKYGLMDSDQIISTYELKMDSEIAAQQKESNTKLLQKYLEEIKPETVTVVMGEIYLSSVDFDSLNIPITYIKGEGIGYMLGSFKSWLDKLSAGISKSNGFFSNL